LTYARRLGALGAPAIAVALMSSACTKRYTEIEVRDPGRVAVAMWSTQGAATVLPANSSQGTVALPVPGMTAMRRGREVAVAWEDRPPVVLIDERGILPRLPAGPGVEIRGRTLWAAYNVTPKRVLPQRVTSDDAIPILLTTDMTNVLDAREVRETRKWPAFVLLPAGILLTLLGTAALASRETGDKIGGGVLLAGAVPMITFGVLSLTSSNEIKPLDLPTVPGP
jgi:hypothetical protein